MGLFDAYGVNAEEVNEDSVGGIQPGTYEAAVCGARINEHDEYGTSLILQYKINGTETVIEEWFNLPSTPAPWDDTEKDSRGYTQKQTNDRNMALIKKRLLILGVPEDKVNQVDPTVGHLDGIKVVLNLVKNKKGYASVAKQDGVRLWKEPVSSLPTPATSPAASAAAAGFNPTWS